MSIDEEFNFNEKTGLTKDALNPLTAKITLLSSISDLEDSSISDLDKKHYLEYKTGVQNRVKKDLPTYNKYFREKYPEEFDEIIKKANPKCLNKYNSTIREYNQVNKSMRLDLEFNGDYLASLQKIISGL